MEYVTRRFENTPEGLREKDAVPRQLAAQGYRIISEQIEQGHIKGGEQCCGALICLPLIFLAGRTPGNIIVTYGREIAAPLHVELPREPIPDQAALLLVNQRQIAADKTIEARKAIEKLDNILIDNLGIDHQRDWGAVITQYPVPEPIKRGVKVVPNSPQWADFVPKLSLIEKLLPNLRSKKLAAAHHACHSATSMWKQSKEQTDLENTAATNEYEQALNDWEENRKRYEIAQSEEAEKRRQSYLSRDIGSLKEYWKTISDRSGYFEGFPNSHGFDYLPETRTLIVEYDLPAIGSLPEVQEVRYVESRKEFENINFQEPWLKDFYSRLICKICLATLYALFQSDTAEAVDNIVFNGNVRAIDPATGHKVNSCVLSVQTSKLEFMAMNLSQVDPKACVKRLKGVASENMVALDPIVPIQRVDKG